MADPRSQDDTPAIPAVVNNLQHVKQTMGRLTRTFIFHTTLVNLLILKPWDCLWLMANGNNTIITNIHIILTQTFGPKTCKHVITGSPVNLLWWKCVLVPRVPLKMHHFSQSFNGTSQVYIKSLKNASKYFQGNVINTFTLCHCD